MENPYCSCKLTCGQPASGGQAYRYDAATCVFTLDHSETGVPYGEQASQTVRAELSLDLKVQSLWRVPTASVGGRT